MDDFRATPQDASRPCLPLTRSHVYGACSVPLILKTNGQLLDEAAAAKPDHHVFIIPQFEQKISFKELHEKASALSRAFLSLGLKKGDIVMVIGYGGFDYVSTYFAITQIGCVFYAPYLYNPKTLLVEKSLKKLDCKALVICGDADGELLKVFKDVAGTITKDSNGVCSYANFPNLKHVVAHNKDSIEHVCTFKTLHKLAQSVEPELLERAKFQVDTDDNVWIINSTGSTGAPKYSAISNLAFTTSCLAIILRNSQDDKGNVYVSQSPIEDELYPVFNIMMATLQYRLERTFVILPVVDHTVSFETTTNIYRKIMQDQRVTDGNFFPHVWTTLFMSNKFDISKLKKGMTSGWRVAEETNAKICEQVPGFCVHFCATECAPMTMGYIDDHHVERRKTVGFVSPHLELKLVDEEGNVVPIGHKGEMWVRGPAVFSYYVGDPDLTSKAKDSRGWYHTGDMLKMTEEGFLQSIGRKADAVRFKSWGDVVFPGYIEDTVKLHEAVADCKVIGVPHDFKGDNICLCLVIKDEQNNPVTTKEMEDFIVQKLSKKDLPDYIFFMKEIPKIGSRRKVPFRQMVKLCEDLIKQEEKSFSELEGRLNT